ncbi:MAG TPA: hypothetical protein VF796_03645 [Humisphaera sp.]
MDGTVSSNAVTTHANPVSVLRRVPDHHPRTAWSTGLAGLAIFAIALVLLIVATGCQDQTSLIPNSDPALRKTKTEFAKDALQRHPYHADAPKAGKAAGAATVNYEMDRLQVANLSEADWTNVELWVNGKYVVFLPKVPGKAETAKTIDFSMLYDELGRPFPAETGSPERQVKKVEVYRDGRMYELAGLDVE